jgi:hypothetical protein
MKSFKKKSILITMVLVVSTIISCDLDINVDPNAPSTVPSGQLLSASEVAIFTSFGHNGSGLGQVASIWVHQVMQRSNADGYASTGTDANINNPWVNLYSGALKDIETIIAQSNDRGEFRYVGIAKLLKAYSYSMMVDAWGDIPYSQAVLGTENPFPVFDDDQAIYNSLFTLIDEALADLAKTQDPAAISPTTDDLIYGGSVTNWTRFGKVLKLKMYNTIKGVQNVTAELNALVSDPDVINFAADFELRYTTTAAPENRNPTWISVSGATTYFSRYFYEILNNKSTLNPVLSGIVDPRLPYYLYSSLGTSNTTAQNPTEYRDQPYATILNGAGVPTPTDQRFFVGINFSSQSPNQGFDQSRSLSMPGVYFCGGRFDPAQVGGGVIVGSAPGNAPGRLLNSFQVSYILAEIALTNSDIPTARTQLSTAIDRSFAKVNSVTTTVFSTAATIPNSARDTYRNAVLAKFDAASNTGKLELIITQKWIANFGNSLESYTDYRRTGFPIMIDPATDGDPNTNISRAYPFSFPYRQLDTKQQNPNAPDQKLIGDPSARVFWDNN